MPRIFLPSSFIHWYQNKYHRCLSTSERALIDSLERHRIASGRNNVLAAINDPKRIYTSLLAAYAAWFQQTFCPGLDAAIFAPETVPQAEYKYGPLAHLLSNLTIHTCRQRRWVPEGPIGIAIMYGSDLYCPSYANYRRPRIHTFLSWIIPAMPTRGHLILIIGDATHRRTAFADAFTGRIRRTRHPNIHCFRPRQITLAAYKKIDVEQVSRPATHQAEPQALFSAQPQASAWPPVLDCGPNKVRTFPPLPKALLA